jgi:hypothetical protein
MLNLHFIYKQYAFSIQSYFHLKYWFKSAMIFCVIKLKILLQQSAFGELKMKNEKWKINWEIMVRGGIIEN